MAASGDTPPPVSDEQSPLLEKRWQFDLNDLRDRAARLEPLEDYKYVEFENMPGYVVFRHIASALAQVAVVLGAYFFLQSTGNSIMPHCDLWARTGAAALLPRYSLEHWKEHMCYATSGCFWTYPIVCPLAIIILFWKNLLDKRLFYECLFNRIFLLQHSASYVTSPTFWFLLVYFVCGVSCIFYIRDGTDKPYDEIIFSMLAYICPTVGFVIVLFSNWSASRLIISLPLFVDRDCPAAMELLKDCRFVADEDFWRGFQLTEERYASISRDQRMAFTLNTAELMTFVLDSLDTGSSSNRSYVGQLCGCCQAIYERFFRSYWVSRFLWFPVLHDIRAQRFRRWARLYYIFMWIAHMIFAYAMLYTINELLAYYKSVPMYVPLPAPHKVPGVLEDLHANVSKHIPGAVEHVKRELPDRVMFNESALLEIVQRMRGR